MKNIFISFILLASVPKIPDTTKLYIANYYDDPTRFEIFKFCSKDSVAVEIYGKDPKYTYDFLADSNLKWVKKYIDGKVYKERKYFCIYKGDSMFVDRSDAMLTIISRGVWRGNELFLNTVMSMHKGTTGKLDVLKTANQVFKPY